MHKQKSLSGFFSFSRSENRGLFILIICVLILLIVRIFVHRDSEKLSLVHTSSGTTAELFVDSCVSYEKDNIHFNNPGRYQHRNKRTIQQVDPNTASFNSLVDAGIPKRAAANILAYRKKGGKFSSPEDLLIIYGIDSALLLKIGQAISIEQLNTGQPKNMQRSGYPVTAVDLNHADTSELLKLPGIGRILSKRIINYRNVLGGFYRTDQLTEVYGISDSLYRLIDHFIILDTMSIKKMDINSITIDELQKHPYLDNYQAKAIMSYRRLVGPFKSITELSQNYLVPDENYAKIKHYLTIN